MVVSFALGLVTVDFSPSFTALGGNSSHRKVHAFPVPKQIQNKAMHIWC